MKQVYAAGALNTIYNTSVKAATTGTASDDLQNVLTAMSYLPPAAYEPQSETSLPIRLALLKTSRGRVLTHVTPHQSRSSWFAHTLLDIPATADAQLAIQTWGSPLWQKQEPEYTTDLPELPYLPVADVLDERSIQEWLKSPAHQDLFEFALAALLGTPTTARIFLAAKADDVAKVVYAITLVLPQSFLEDFTFSTYEAAPLACSARIIGSDTGSNEIDLPADCYAAPDVAYHAGTGRRSELPVEVPYASFAVKAAATQEYAGVDEVKATWQRLGLHDQRQFDLVYRLSRGTGVMSKSEAAEMLKHPPLATYVSTRSDALQQFLEWALEDRDFAVNSFTRAAQALRQKPELAAKLAQQVRDGGVVALKQADVERASNALEIILPMVAPTKANAIWGELPSIVGDPEKLSWGVRHWMLPKLIRFKQQQGITNLEPQLEPWFNVPTEQLEEFLNLDLPKSHLYAAARKTMLRDGEPSEVFARIVAPNVPLCRTLLVPKPHEEVYSQKLFTTLLAVSPHTPWLEELLAHASDYTAETLNSYFETALAASYIDADRLIRTHGERLLELFRGQTGLDKIAALLLANPPQDLLRQDTLESFLNQLLEQSQITNTVKSRIQALNTIRSFVNHPTFEAESQAKVAKALELTPPVVPAATKAELFDTIVDTLTARAEAADLQTNLETTLVQFGDVLASGSTDLFENLLRTIRGKVDFGKQTNLVSCFLAVALGATEHPELAGKLDGLDGHAFTIAGDAAKRGGKKLLAEIDTRATAWPKAARTQWNFLAAAVRPRGNEAYLRDAAMIALGVAITGVIWAISSLLG